MDCTKHSRKYVFFYRELKVSSWNTVVWAALSSSANSGNCKFLLSFFLLLLRQPTRLAHFSYYYWSIFCNFKYIQTAKKHIFSLLCPGFNFQRGHFSFCSEKFANIQIIVQPQARKLRHCTNLLQHAEVTQGKISWKRSQEANILSFRSWLLNPMNPFDPPASRQLPLNCRTWPSIQDSSSSKGLAMLWRNIEKCPSPFASIQFSGNLKVSPEEENQKTLCPYLAISIPRPLCGNQIPKGKPLN